MTNYNFINGLCEALTEESDRRENSLNFVLSQINEMPDYLKAGIKIATLGSRILILIFFFRPFHKINLMKRRKIIGTVQKKNLPVLSDLLKFYSSLILLRSHETFQKK